MDKTNIKYSKYCVVPQCQSTLIRTPDKIFISLPAGSAKQLQKRRLWLQAMKRNIHDLSENTRGYVCQDHFNVCLMFMFKVSFDFYVIFISVGRRC